jgi:hypothetical protein
MRARSNGRAPLALLLTACCVVSVAQRFAEAIFHGQGDAAVALLADAEDRPLSSLAKRSAAAWRTQHGVVRFGEKPSPRHWIFRYTGERTHDDGRFEQVRGALLVVIGPSPHGPGVEFFSLRNESVRYGTHRDSVLLPSNR